MSDPRLIQNLVGATSTSPQGGCFSSAHRLWTLWRRAATIDSYTVAPPYVQGRSIKMGEEY